MGCGTPPSDRLARQRVYRAKRSDGGTSWFGVVLVALMQPLLVAGLAPRRHQRVELRVPFCEACGSTDAFEPGHVDFDEGRIELVVHRRFAEVLRRARSQRGAAG